MHPFPGRGEIRSPPFHLFPYSGPLEVVLPSGTTNINGGDLALE